MQFVKPVLPFSVWVFSHSTKTYRLGVIVSVNGCLSTVVQTPPFTQCDLGKAPDRNSWMDGINAQRWDQVRIGLSLLDNSLMCQLVSY